MDPWPFETSTLVTGAPPKTSGITGLKAGPEFEVLVENDLNDYTLSSPAISDGHIFMRTAQFLYSIGKK